MRTIFRLFLFGIGPLIQAAQHVFKILRPVEQAFQAFSEEKKICPSCSTYFKPPALIMGVS